MTQKFEYRGIPVPGVTRSCNDRCDPDCAKHTWGWTLEWTGRDGCRKRDGNRGYRTGREAMLAREIAWQAVKEGLAPGKKMTVAEWLTEWIEDRESPQSDRPLEPTTAATYRRHIELYLIPQLGRVRLDKLTPMDVGSCLRRVRDERDAERKLAKAAGKPEPRAIGPTTAARIRATLSSALADAAELELVSRNVAGVTRNHRRREDEHRELPRVWQPTQLFGFLKALAEAEERLYPMIMLAAFTGLRRGELLGLRWSDVDLDDRSLLVQWQRTTIGYKVLEKKTKTSRSATRIPLIDGIVLVLRLWKEVQDEDAEKMGDLWPNNPQVFTWENGEPYHPDYITKKFKKLTRRYGAPLSNVDDVSDMAHFIHSLRHTFASLQISSGASTAVVSKNLRHSRYGITVDTYGHMIGEAGRGAIEAAEKFMTDSTKPSRSAVTS